MAACLNLNLFNTITAEYLQFGTFGLNHLDSIQSGSDHDMNACKCDRKWEPFQGNFLLINVPVTEVNHHASSRSGVMPNRLKRDLRLLRRGGNMVGSWTLDISLVNPSL